MERVPHKAQEGADGQGQRHPGGYGGGGQRAGDGGAEAGEPGQHFSELL